MRSLSADADPEAERVQIELLRQAGPTRRAAMALSLSAQVIDLARRATSLTSSDVLRALSPVVDTLEALGVRYYVGGSLASSAHGVPRASIDADVIADLAGGEGLDFGYLRTWSAVIGVHDLLQRALLEGRPSA